MQRLLAPLAGMDTARLNVRLRWLQRALPAAIIVIVLTYEVAFEFVLHDFFPSWVRFTLESLVFGLAGACVTWVSLEWVRRRVEEEARQEQMARRHERQLAAITANSADAIILQDNDGLVQSWNRGAELIFGYTSEEVIGRHFRFLLPESLNASGELEFINRELERQGFIRGHVTRRVAKDGRVISVELTRTVLRDETGQVVGSSAILRDVTERERAETAIREMNHRLEGEVQQRTKELIEANRELQRRQRELEKANAELQQLDKLKSEFVSLVSHELRSPLTNISGSLQLLLDGHGGLTEDQREILALANEQVGRLGRLVKGILNISRIEAGQMEFAPQAFDVLDLIERTLGSWAVCDPQHAYRGPDAHNVPSVWADRDRVEEVMLNLIENATKYSREGSEIRVEVQTGNEQVVVAVSDQGEGITNEELAKIFDKFHRVERDDARQTYGHGLGLYISRKLIEEMGGRLWGESQVGSGSTFSFSLPLAGHARLENMTFRAAGEPA